MSTQPSICRAVVFVGGDGRDRPAVVIEANPDGSCDLGVMGTTYMYHHAVPFAAIREDGTRQEMTWHWPVRQ